jgi:FkbM family methyltransferase
MDTIELSLADGVQLAVPATLDSITTYVVLEQDTWFEKEAEFLRHWLRPGMTAIDVGANLGFYSLLIAQRVGPQGRVYAYEPASDPRALLERNRTLNSMQQIEILPTALSDRAHEGRIVFGASSELNALGDGGKGEDVHVTSLDTELAERNWAQPDFIKIDVEGGEERILAGGKQFFAECSPLVMFETRTEATFNEQLRAAFSAIGYKLYRQMGNAPVLLPADIDPLDRYELNAFAAKPDRAAALVEDGFLVESVGDWKPTDTARSKPIPVLARQPFAEVLKPQLARDMNLDATYRDALAGYATWRRPERPTAERCAALLFALRALRAVCQANPTAERLSTLARAAFDWGARDESVQVARRIADLIRQGPLQLREPFWPADPAFDAIKPVSPIDFWLFGAAASLIERASHYSSLYSGASATLMLVGSLPEAPIEIERRRVLTAARAGRRPKVPDRLRVPAPDHRNAVLWREGRVPGTVL